MSDSQSEFEQVGKLAESFLARYRKGERPALTEYTDKYPELAEQIREYFPALVVMEELGSVEASVTATPPGQDTKPIPVPQQLGEYRILREVGHGGMGVVYEAVQETLGRHVALKVLPFHGLLGSHHLERFQREARAAARLHHTNIVPVFGVGEDKGVHFYAMQFIQGQGLHEVLHEVKRLRQRTKDAAKGVDTGTRGRGDAAKEAQSPPLDETAPAPNPLAVNAAHSLITGTFAPLPPSAAKSPTGAETLPMPESARSGSGSGSAISSLTGSQSGLTTQSEAQYFRGVAQIGVQVAEALEYAHRQGVLHRDIKPSNLLLDTRGTVWITDFGLAKASPGGDASPGADSGGEELTRTGDIVGTVRYMAPERFAGLADARSDVYSLGVTLYELLTLQPLFEGSDQLRLIGRIRNDEPAPLRRIDKRIPRDLETIILKSIRKEPDRRYGSGLELAEDLRRFLADRPVYARRASSAERAWRWVKRNPGLSASLAASILILAVSAIVAWAFYFESQRALKNEAEQHAEAVRQTNEAIAARNKAQENFNEAEKQRQRAVKSEARAMAVVKEYFVKVTESQLLTAPGLQPLRRDLLTRALHFYEGYLKERGDDPMLQAELAAARVLVGRICSELGQFDEARNAYGQARVLYQALLKTEPDNHAFQHGLAQTHGYGSPEAIEIWEKLVVAEPDNTEYQRDLANAYNSLALSYTDRELRRQKGAYDPVAALKVHQKALVIRERLVQNDPENVEYRNDLGATLNNIGVLLADKNQNQEALAMYRRASEHIEVAYSRAPQVVVYGRFLSTNYQNVASIHARLGELDEALPWQIKCVNVSRRLVVDNPAVPALRSNLGAYYSQLARYQRELGKAADAALSARLARDVIERIPRATADDLFQMARVRALYAATVGEGKTELTDEEQAEQKREADQAMDALKRSVAAGAKYSIKNQKDFEILHDREDFKTLVANLEKTVEADKLAAGVKGQPAERLPMLQKAVEARRAVAAADPKNAQTQLALATNLQALGTLQGDLSQTDDGIRTLREALTIRQGLLRSNPKNVQLVAAVAQAETALGGVHFKGGRYAEGARWFDEATGRFDTALQAAPQNTRLLEQSAGHEQAVAAAYAEAGLWDVTARHLAKVFERQSPDYQAEFWRLHACLLLLEGDTEGYRKQCERMIERFGKSSNSGDWHRLAAACLLAPEGYGDLTRWVELQEKYAAAEPKQSWAAFYVGLAYYRTRRYEDAVKRLEQVNDWAQTWPVRAMAEMRLGKAEEARKWLAKADAAIDKALATQRTQSRLTDPLAFSSGWIWDRPQFLLFYREAKTLIDGPTAEDPWRRLLANRPIFKPGRPREADLADNLHAIGVLQGELGQAEEAGKSLAEALAIREALVKKNPNLPDFKGDLAATQIALGNLEWKASRFSEAVQLWEKGLAHFDAALQQTPKDAALLRQSAHHARLIGERYAHFGLWNEAARHHLQAFERQPPVHAGDWDHLAYLLLMTGDLSRYQSHCAQMLERFGSTSDILAASSITRACTVGQLKAVDAARVLGLAQKSAAADPKARDRALYLALAQCRAGHPEEAIRLLEGNEGPSSLLANALAYHQLGQKDKSQAWLDRAERWLTTSAADALATTTGSRPIAFWRDWALIQCLRREVKHALAGAATPDHPSVLLLRGRGYALIGNWERANAEFDAAVAAAPADPEIRLARGKVFGQLGRHDLAGADFAKAAELKPDDPGPLIFRGRYLVERGEHDKADQDFAKAAKITSDNLNRFIEPGWWVVGTYPVHLNIPCPPEADPDPSKPAAAFNPFPAVAAGTPMAGLATLGGLAVPRLDWVHCLAEGHGLMVQRGHPALTKSRDKSFEDVSLYAVTYVYSPDERQATFLLGGDDHMRLWVNGKLVHETTKILSNEWALDRASATLKPGRNTLLVKVNNSKSNYYFRVRLEDNPIDRAFKPAQLGLWDEAAAMWSKLPEPIGDNSWLETIFASLLTTRGELDACRARTARMLDRWAASSNTWDLWHVCRACTLAPGAIQDPAAFMPLAEKAFLATDTGSDWRKGFLALAYYRVGQFEKAVQTMPDDAKLFFPSKYSVLAMAHHRLGQAQEARKYLTQADQTFERLMRDALATTPLKMPLNWWDWADFLSLRREAHELIEGKQPPEDPNWLILRARAYAQLGEHAKAEAEFQRAAALNPSNPHLLLARSTTDNAGEVRRFTGHTGPVTAVAFSPDGRQALTAEDKTLRLYDVESGRELRSFQGPAGEIWSAAFLPNGREALSADRAGNVCLWDVTTGQRVREFKSPHGVVTVSVSRDGRHAVWGGYGSLELRDLETGEKVREFKGHTKSVYASALSPDGRYLLTGSLDNTARLWDLATGQEIRRFEGHTEMVWSVAFSPDGHRALTAGGGQRAETGPWPKGTDHAIRIWDVETGKELGRLNGHTSWVLGVGFLPDGRHVLSASSDGTLRYWDSESGQELRRFAAHAQALSSGQGFAVSADGLYALTSSFDKTVRLWRLPAPTVGEVRRFTVNPPKVHHMALSRDGRRVLVGGYEGLFALYDVQTGKELRRFDAGTDTIWWVALSPDGRRVLSVAGLWDAETGEALRRFKAGAVAFSPDGRLAATAIGKGEIQVWEVESGKQVVVLKGHGDIEGHDGSIDGLAFSTDSRRLLSAGKDQTLRLWDVETGKELHRLAGHEHWVRSPVFSPDGRRALSVGCKDGSVRLWDLEAGKELRRFEHTGFLNAVAFSPDGLRAISAGGGTIRLWDVEAGIELQRFTGQGGVNAVDFLPDGRHAVSASNDGTIRAWRLPQLTPREDAGFYITRGRHYFERGEHDKADTDFARAASLTSEELNRFLDAGWWISGPFPGDLKTPHGPELTFSLPRRGFDRSLPPGAHGNVNVRALFGDAENICFYALAHVYSPDERSTTLLVGGGHKLARLWFNGKVVHDMSQPRTWEWGLDRVPVTLRAGRNEILVKVSYHAKDNHYFVCRLADAPLDRGLALAELGLWDEAATFFKQGFDRQAPANAWICGRYATLLLATGDDKAYRRVCAEMEERFRDSPGSESLYQLARACALSANGMKDPVTLLETAKKGQASPHVPQAWRGLALALAQYRAGQFDEAIRRLDESKDIFWPQNDVVLAMAHYRAGRTDKARELLAKVDKLYEDESRRALAAPAFKLPWAWQWYEYADFLTLRREAKELIEGSAPGEDANVKAFQARARELLAKLDPLTGEYDHALWRQPKEAHLWLARGRRFAELKRWDEAEADLNKAVELKSNDPMILAERGRIYAERGQPDKAAQDFSKALDQLPQRAEWARDPAGLDTELARMDAVFPLLVKLRHNDKTLWMARGHYHARQADWEQTGAAVAKWMELDGADHNAWMAAGTLKLHQGDTEGYRRFCRELLERFGQTTDATIARRTAQLCLMAPDAVADLKPVWRLTELGTAELEQQKNNRWLPLTRGMADYRAGKFSTALDWCRQSTTPDARHQMYCDGVAYLFLAMAHHRLGQADDARAALAKAREIAEQKFPKIEQGEELDYRWSDYLRFEIVRREAEALIRPK